MINVLEINNICISCDSCRQICPQFCILTNGKEYTIDTWACTQCMLCKQVCPVDAIKETSALNSTFE